MSDGNEFQRSDAVTGNVRCVQGDAVAPPGGEGGNFPLWVKDR